MEVFRLTRAKYKDKLSGVGASLRGGRWNKKGIEIIYTSGNRSLAMAEVAVHLSIGELPNDYYMLTIYIPDSLPVRHITESELPQDWHRFPAAETTKKFGFNFIKENKFPVLKVPSAITAGDYNYLLNPKHQQYSEVKTISVIPFPFNSRLIR